MLELVANKLNKRHKLELIRFKINLDCVLIYLVPIRYAVSSIALSLSLCPVGHHYTLPATVVAMSLIVAYNASHSVLKPSFIQVLNKSWLNYTTSL